MGRFAFFLMLLVFSVAASSGCAHAAPVVQATPSRLRVLVLTPRLETDLGVDAPALGAALSTGLVRDGGLEATAHGDAELRDPSCIERLSCLRELGQEALADYVAATSITGLGDTAMIRVRLVEVRATGAEQTRQTVVQPADSTSLASALEAIGLALAAPYAPRSVANERAAARRARFRWLGPLLAAGAAGAATGTYYLIRPEGGGPDVVIVPP